MKKILKIDLMKKVADLQDIIRRQHDEIEFLQQKIELLEKYSTTTQVIDAIRSAATLADAAAHMITSVHSWRPK